jgi:predicted RNA-binding Zn ribbon-like protein
LSLPGYAFRVQEPGDRLPAPPPLDLVQAFVNSSDREAEIDRFSSPADLARWLRERRLLGRNEVVSARDLRDAIELREAIRQLLLEHNGERASKDVRASFARYAEESLLVARIDDDGAVTLAPARRGVAGALAQVVAAISEASATGTWPRLKACQADICQWAFYDRSKNRSSRWCSMEVCGSRAKMRRYRARRRRAAR